MSDISVDHYREQHKLRLAYMPWLYRRLKPQQRAWAEPWQQAIQTHIMAMETVQFDDDCFVAPSAVLLAEPGRRIQVGAGSQIAADCVLHGPITLGQQVSINHHATLDGGAAGITVGDHSRIAAYCTIYAFNHGMAPERLVHQQPVTSKGIRIGRDVWIGAQVAIVDGVTIGDGAIVGTAAVVTRDVPAGVKVAGNPAQIIGSR